MPSLDDLAKNAVPPEPSNTTPNQPYNYSKHKKQQAVEVDPSTLGEPAPPPPPTIMDKMMDELDAAIQRDKEQMWDNVISPAKEALEENMANQKAFGSTSDDTYFNGEIGDSPDYKPIDQDIINYKNHSNDKKVEVTEDDSDNFLYDDSIYNKEEDIKEEPKSMNNDNGFNVYNPMNETTNFKHQTLSNEVSQQKPVQQPVAEPVVPEVEDPEKSGSEMYEVDPVVAGSATVTSSGNYNFDDKYINEVFGDDDDVATDDEDDVSDEDMNAMREVVRTKIKPVNNIVDLKGYRISTKPISAGRVMEAINSNLSTAKWVLPATGTSIIMSALLGTEIDMLANRREGQTDLMRNEEIVKTFYNHVVGEKPDSWRAWAKTVLYDDFSHLYFAEYIACFNKASFAPFECDKDKHSFMQPVSIMSMVKYKDDKAKELVNKLLNTDPKNCSISTELRQVSDNVAITFRKPTIWNVMFEDYYLPDKVRREMTDIVAIFRHIDNIFIIDRASGELRPVDVKEVAGDTAKSLKNRFKIYYDILKSLTSDQLNAITPILAELHKDIDVVEYQYPEATCPKCGAIIKPNVTAPIDILFIRHRLQTILA